MALLIGQPTPLPISVSSADYVDHTAGTISHSVVASSSPLATESLLKSSASGYLRLVRLGLGMNPSHPLDVAGNIRLSGDLLHSGDLDIEAAGGDVLFRDTDIQAHDWTSGTTGWGIQHDGTADFRTITADSLIVEAFISDVNLALAGSQIITKSLGILAQPFTVPSTTGFLYVYDLPGLPNTAVFENSDVIRLRYVESGAGLVVSDIWGTVASYTDQADGTQRWTFTRASGTVGQVVAEGMIALDYGAPGDGYVHTTTLDPAGSPYTEVGTWLTDPSNPANHTIHVRLGQLDGISGVGDEWGLWAGQAGETYLLLSDTNFEAHGLALSLYDSNGEAIKLDPAVPSLAIGWPLPTGMSAGGAGLWTGLAGGAYQLRLGEAAGVGLRWDGDDLTLRNASDAAVITLDSAGNSYFAGPVTLGTGGGIYQGTGTFASPTTGLKLWRDSGIGRIGGYNSGTLQWYGSTDGKLYAGAGNVVLDSNGISLALGSGDLNAYKFHNFAAGGAGGMLASAAPEVQVYSRNTGGVATTTLEASSGISGASIRFSAIATSSIAGHLEASHPLHLNQTYLVSYHDSVEYPVYAMRYLTTALTSTSWDGDSKTSANNGTIDLSAVFGVPAGVKAVLVRLSASSATVGHLAQLGPSSGQNNAVFARVQVASLNSDSFGIVPCDGSGDVYVTIVGTVNVNIQIWGYAL